MTNNLYLQPGDSLTLKIISPLYRDLYQATLLAVKENCLVISMPVFQGKMALLGVGTPLELTVENRSLSFTCEVLERGFQPKPYLLIQLPYQLAGQRQGRPRVLTVTSGKGGVGKTTITINLAICLARMGQRVFIIDADLGTANVDVLLNVQPKYNLTHIINREKELLEIIVEGPGGIYLVPGGSGLQNLANMEDWQFNRVIGSLQTLEQYADIIIIDTGAGLGKNIINFALAADNVLIITTPEPHSITDAYAMIKVLDENHHTMTPFLILNRVESPKEYHEVVTKMLNVVNRFLSIKIAPLGYILDDPVIPKANRRMEPFYLNHPDAPASRCLRAIAEKLLNPEGGSQQKPTAGRSFFSRIKELFSN